MVWNGKFFPIIFCQASVAGGAINTEVHDSLDAS